MIDSATAAAWLTSIQQRIVEEDTERVKRMSMEAAIVGVVVGLVVALLLAIAGQALYACILGTP